MADLMPFDQASADALDAKLASTMFRSTSDFITFYNSGLVNKTNDEVSSIADEIADTFKNVRLQGKNFLFISKTEVEMGEILVELRKWDLLVRVKGRLESLRDAGEVTEETVVEFNSASPGVLFRSSQGENEGERLADERFFKPSDEDLLTEVHSHYSSFEQEGESFLFKVGDFTSLDDSFVSSIYSTLFTE